MSPETASKHRTRKQVLTYISRHPGVTFGAIRDIFDLTDSTLRYHLNMLVRTRLVHVKSNGHRKLYYSSRYARVGNGLPTKPEPDEFTRNQQRIITLIQQNPGISVGEISRITRYQKSDVQQNLRKLREMMVISKVGNGRGTGYEYMTKSQLKERILRLLVAKFLKDEIDEETFLYLKEELEKEGLAD